jgi:outer membrane protein OmpU
MRKVLLATTALVAMSVTAAQADVSISGNQTFEVSDTGAATSFFQDGAVTISSVNTTDSGLTLSAVYSMSTSVGNGLGGVQGMDDTYLDIAGDFGSLRLGNTDDALDRNDGVVPSNWDESGHAGGFAIGGGQGAGEATASFSAPSVSGIAAYAFTSAEGAASGMGVNYSNGPIAVMYQTGEDGTDSETLVAANFSMAGATIGFSSGERTTANSVKVKGTSMGIKYAVNSEIDMYYVSQKNAVGEKNKTSLGGYYTVAPGLKVALETADDGETNQTSTYAHIQVSF